MDKNITFGFIFLGSCILFLAAIIGMSFNEPNYDFSSTVLAISILLILGSLFNLVINTFVNTKWYNNNIKYMIEKGNDTK